MKRLVQIRVEDKRISHWSRPARTFSGDVTAAAKTPDGKIWLLLADCTGHGLSAALNVVLVVEMFYGMASLDMRLADVCAELNRKIHLLMPTGRFVCAAIAEIDPQAQRIGLWNGGMPAVLCAGGDGAEIHRWASRHVALGILDEERFDPTLESFQFPPGSQLLMCSDGLLEARSADGSEFGEAGLAALMSGLVRGEPLPELAQRLLAQRISLVHDDATALTVALDF